MTPMCVTFFMWSMFMSVGMWKQFKINEQLESRIEQLELNLEPLPERFVGFCVNRKTGLPQARTRGPNA